MAMGLLSVGLASCSSDDENLPQGGTDFGVADKVYMSLNLSYPTQRAVGDPAIEIGTEGENKVSTVQVILKKGTAIAASSIGNFAGPTAQGNNQRYTATFNAKDLLGLAGQDGVELYAICNGVTTPLDLVGDKKALTSTDFSTLANEAYWKSNGFLMANADGAATTSIPAKEILMAQNSTQGTALNLGVVEVERAAARIDYQTKQLNNEYPIDDQGGKKVATINLDGYTLGHVSKEFYTMIRTNDGTDGGLATLGKAGGLYVVDVDWAQTPNLIQPAVSNPDINTQVGAYVNYAYSNLDALANPDNWNGADGQRNDYKLMSYVSENTVPADKNKWDKKGYATAVYFKGYIEANTETPTELKTAIESNNPLVVYNNMLLGDWAMVEALAAGTGEEPGNPFAGKPSEFAGFKTNYELAKNDGLNASTEITHEIAKNHGFTIYETDGTAGKHEVYYPYWNEHDAANMEYAVVRNNVYKLQINNILKYGLPRNGSVDPEEPIKSNDVYFQLAVDVLPWAVKVNDIEF